jgi:oligoendopeptidase F
MEEKHKEKIQKIKDLALRRESRMYEELLENEEKIKTQAAKLSNYAKDRQDAICADEMSGRRKYPNVEKTVNQGGGL